MSNRKLSLIYDKREKDFVAKYPTRKVDGDLLLYHLVGEIPIRSSLIDTDGNTTEWYNFKEDLEKRGYDITTLRFSIELKQEP